MGGIALRLRPAALSCGVAALVILAPAVSTGAELTPAQQADLRRAMAAVGGFSSPEPALREARAAGDPSPAFVLGAELAAWINAAAQLDFDTRNPTAAGPPHISQTGGDAEALADDCRDEKTAFAGLENGRQGLGLTLDAVAASARLAPDRLAAWRARQAGAPPRCT